MLFFPQKLKNVWIKKAWIIEEIVGVVTHYAMNLSIKIKTKIF